MRYALLLLGAMLTTPALAGELAGVTLPDQVTTPAGQSLVLNGLGLREKLWIDVYVGGLYLPAKTTDAKKAINDDVPKQIVMSFIYKEVSKEKMLGMFTEALQKNPETASMTAEINQLTAMFDRAVVKGDVITLDYQPGTGLTVMFNDDKKGTIAGAAIMRGIWDIFLGDKPPTAALKSGLLGN